MVIPFDSVVAYRESVHRASVDTSLTQIAASRVHHHHVVRRLSEIDLPQVFVLVQDRTVANAAIADKVDVLARVARAMNQARLFAHFQNTERLLC